MPLSVELQIKCSNCKINYVCFEGNNPEEQYSIKMKTNTTAISNRIKIPNRFFSSTGKQEIRLSIDYTDLNGKNHKKLIDTLYVSVLLKPEATPAASSFEDLSVKIYIYRDRNLIQIIPLNQKTRVEPQSIKVSWTDELKLDSSNHPLKPYDTYYFIESEENMLGNKTFLDKINIILPISNIKEANKSVSFICGEEQVEVKLVLANNNDGNGWFLNGHSYSVTHVQ